MVSLGAGKAAVTGLAAAAELAPPRGLALGGMALVGSGSAVPAVSLSNQRLSERVDTNDEWIRTRTGIGARRIAGPSESLTCLASSAAQAAHWMCCPKCGGTMAEKKFENVMIDQCTACGGIYFDAGELDMLIKHEKSGQGVLGRLFGR